MAPCNQILALKKRSEKEKKKKKTKLGKKTKKTSPFMHETASYIFCLRFCFCYWSMNLIFSIFFHVKRRHRSFFSSPLCYAFSHEPRRGFVFFSLSYANWGTSWFWFAMPRAVVSPWSSSSSSSPLPSRIVTKILTFKGTQAVIRWSKNCTACLTALARLLFVCLG